MMQNIHWKLDKGFRESIYDGIVLKEHINIKMVRGFILANRGKEQAHSTYLHANEVKQMEGYLTKYNKDADVFLVRTKLPQHKWGRITYDNHQSIAIFHRSTRHSYCDGIYIDIDIVNSAPSIICEVSKLNNYHQIDALKYYVENRDIFTQELMDYYNVSKDCIKKLFLIIIMGGSYITWIKENDIDVMGKEEPTRIKDIIQELSFIRDIVYANNPSLQKIKMKNTNNTEKNENEYREKLSVFAFWYQSIERAIQESIIKFISYHRGVNITEIIPCQDGFMILENEWYDTILNDCENEVKRIFGISLKLKRKEFDEKYPIEECELEDFEKTESGNILSFLDTKIDFLKYIFKCEKYNGMIFKESDNVYYKYNISTTIFEPVKMQEIAQDFGEYTLALIRKNEKAMDKSIFNRLKLYYGNNMREIIHGIIPVDNVYREFNKLLYFIPLKDNKLIYIGEHNCKINGDEIVFETSPSLFNKINGRIYKPNEILDRTHEHKFNYFCNVEYKNLSEAEFIFCQTYFNELFCNDKDTVQCVLNILKTVISGVIMKNIFCCIGEKGNNGKSVFFDILLKGIMGKSMDVINKSVMVHLKSSSSLNTEFEKLDKIKLGYVNEFASSDILNVTELKKISGGDNFTLRTLHTKEFSMKATCNLFMNTNSIPQLPPVKDDDENNAILNRLVFIPFQNIFKKDIRFIPELKSNLDAMFSYIIQYGIIPDGELELSDEIKSLNNNYKEDNQKDSFLKNYLSDFVEVCEGHDIKRDELYNNYYDWCMDNNINLKKIPIGDFSKMLNKTYKIKNEKRNNITYYINVKYK